MIVGKVTDSKMGPLAYSNVFVSDKSGKPLHNIGTITGYDGTYSLDYNPESSFYLSASFVGYGKSTQLVSPGAKSANFKLASGTSLPPVTVTDTPITFWDKNKNKILIGAGVALLIGIGIKIIS